MSFRNRTMIAGATGPLRLSVPIVDGRNERQFYKEVKLVDGRWRMEHFRAIVSCYNRSPWFEYYRDEMSELFQHPFEYLFDWNLHCHEWVVKKLGLENPFKITNGDELITGDFENAVNEFAPGTYSNQINLPVYTQVFKEKTGFIAGLSILDLLFCEGPSAVVWLKEP
ncbi:WbqC family protein [Flavihumibacter sp. RY-1]|uniref:WbqC family protein n=2 Tax=Flavihumibacter fluminis TaxID=2909236 RepID=A0ABS9BIH2_9BACT|nr:WbqC family protein [Flavihumibacter fluminis]